MPIQLTNLGFLSTDDRSERFPLLLSIACLMIPALIILCTLLQKTYEIQYLYMDPNGAAQTAILRADISGQAGVPYVFGIVSIIGSLVWGFPASALILAGMIRFYRGNKRDALVLFYAATFTAMLVIDDVLRVHENISGVLPINETPVMATYVVMGASYFAAAILRFRDRIQLYPLFASLSFFALSVLADRLLFGLHTSWEILLEDGPKLYGIFFWSAFHWRFALSMSLRSSCDFENPPLAQLHRKQA